MKGEIMQKYTSIAGTAILILAGVATADELTMMVEQDLSRLGYATGPVDGEETLETTIAISKFQADNSLDVTGEVSSELARALMTAQPGGGSGIAPAAAPAAAPVPASAQAPAPTAAPATDPAALQAAQNACLQEKVAAAQEAQKKKRGFGRLLRAVTRTASREGNYELARTADDVYYAGATADDLSAAAKDLGLTDDDVAACQNP